ncbi:MAG: response regulator, partial [Candidatus Omnitrophica bacterium]|nr:response regulator [Candidatus Omnitrophota bacterium]
MNMKIDRDRQMKILIVDDDEGTREALRYMLEREKFIVEEAENGLEALEKVAESKPDIIL